MSMYPNIKKLALYVTESPHLDPCRYWVSAHDLEKLLESAITVYGGPKIYSRDAAWFVTPRDYREDAYTAMVIGIQDIKREPIKLVQTFSSEYIEDEIFKPRELTGKRFRVTFEEIP